MDKSLIKGWELIGKRPHYGINIPLFSLHTTKSSGIGEFLDLLPVIDWCHRLQLDIIQLLPLNDTGREPSPYSAISAFALNPLHISLYNLKDVDIDEDLQLTIKYLKELNHSSRVIYKEVLQLKMLFFESYFEKKYQEISQTEDYINFLIQNPWLKEYALFKHLKVISNWQPWEDWEIGIKDANPEVLLILSETYNKEISFHIFLQYLAFSQLAYVHQYATEKNIFLKGDIPILISKESAEVWAKRELFCLDFYAGAPPDVYAKEGQNWHLPLYNWEEMEKQNYSFWKARLATASQFYDLFRIDHIVGFFRIWAIPCHKSSLEGHFEPTNPDLWLKVGTNHLIKMLDTCSMLPIGEDLGTVPFEIKNRLQELGISGTKVMRWERDWDNGGYFIPLDLYPKESMTTVSTHDSETLRQWWKNCEHEAKAFCAQHHWNYEKDLSFKYHLEILKMSHHTASFFHINLLNEYLALINELRHDNPDDERINDPANLNFPNWTAKYKCPFEEIAAHPVLSELILSL